MYNLHIYCSRSVGGTSRYNPFESNTVTQDENRNLELCILNLTPCTLSSSCLEVFPKYAMSWLSPPSNEVLVPKCLLSLVNWCEISNLHKINLEFQKYHKADHDTILRSERDATHSY